MIKKAFGELPLDCAFVYKNMALRKSAEATIDSGAAYNARHKNGALYFFDADDIVLVFEESLCQS